MNSEKLKSYWNREKRNVKLISNIFEALAGEQNLSGVEQFFGNLDQDVQQNVLVQWYFLNAFLRVGDVSGAEQKLSLDIVDVSLKTYVKSLILFIKGNLSGCREFISGQLQLDHDGFFLDSTKLLLIRVEFLLGDLTTAREFAEKQTGDITKHPEFLGLLSLIVFDLGEVDLANSIAEEALTAQTLQSEATITKISYLLYHQQIENADKLSQTLLAMEPNNGRLFSLAGQCKMLLLEVQPAWTLFVKATELMANHIGTWHLKAWCELMLENPEAAEHSFQQALQLNPNFADSHGGLAITAAIKQDTTEAEKLIKIARRLDPLSHSAVFAQSLLLKQDGKDRESQDLIQSIISSDSHLSGVSYQTLVDSLIKH